MEKLASAQVKMKRLYDRKAEQHQFSPSDHVLALLPIVTSPFQAKFTGPFTVLRQVSEQNYLLSMPKCRKSTQLCHVNLLKHYFENVPPVSDSSGKEQDRSVRSVSVAATVGTIYDMGDWGSNPSRGHQSSVDPSARSLELAAHSETTNIGAIPARMSPGSTRSASVAEGLLDKG